MQRSGARTRWKQVIRQLYAYVSPSSQFQGTRQQIDHAAYLDRDIPVVHGFWQLRLADCTDCCKIVRTRMFDSQGTRLAARHTDRHDLVGEQAIPRTAAESLLPDRSFGHFNKTIANCADDLAWLFDQITRTRRIAGIVIRDQELIVGGLVNASIERALVEHVHDELTDVIGIWRIEHIHGTAEGGSQNACP